MLDRSNVITVLRRFGRWSLEDQEHAERRQEAQALGGPVGQTKYVKPAYHTEKDRKRIAASFTGIGMFQWLKPRANNVKMDCRWLTRFVIAVMDRDRRLTGYLRGQTDQALAPAGFEFTNGWRVSSARDMISDLEMVSPRVRLLTVITTGREACLVRTKLPQLHTETDTIARCARSCFSFDLFLLV